jgi:hypothetical protein
VTCLEPRVATADWPATVAAKERAAMAAMVRDGEREGDRL